MHLCFVRQDVQPWPDDEQDRNASIRSCTTEMHAYQTSIVAYGTSAAVPTKNTADASIDSTEGAPSTTYPVLIRATNGKSGDARKAGEKVKLATLVDSDALEAFYARYAEICKAGMLALKPRDRSKRKTKGKKKKPATA